MRGGAVFWNFETYNPPLSRDNWANLDSDQPRADRIQHRSSYLDLDDPSWLGEQFIREAEELRDRNPRRYEHEYLGKPVGSGGNVFNNLQLRPITDAELNCFDHIYQGVDWGWFPDPFAFIRLHYDAARETVYLLDELYGEYTTMVRQQRDYEALRDENYRLWVENTLLKAELLKFDPPKAAAIAGKSRR